MITITVGGINLGTFLGAGNLRINDIRGRGGARRDITTLEVPSRDGAFLRRINTPPRELEIDITIDANSVTDLRDKVDLLNGAIATDAIVPITFSDEDKTYFGILSDTSSWDEVRSIGKGTLVFTCLDPFKYDAENSQPFLADGTATIEVGGNEPALPRIEATVLSDLTNVDFVLQTGEYIRLGQPSGPDDNVYEEETLILHDQMTSTASWTTAPVVDNGYAAGTMSVVNGGFKPSTFGSAVQPYNWQGPSLKRSIGTPLDQFRIDVLVENLNTGANEGTGMIEIYLLDANNNTVAKIGIEDVSRTSNLNQVKMQVGPAGSTRHTYTRTAAYPQEWNDYKGLIRLSRYKLDDGTYVYHPYFAEIKPDGTEGTRSTQYRFYDYGDAHTAQVTQVQVAMRKWPGYQDQTAMKVNDIKVYQINEQPEGIPTIFKAGDFLSIDFATEEILVNGQPRKDLTDFGSDFFAMQPGFNTVFQMPADSLNSTLYWRNKFK